jgi:EmrB/QacA subfamily drug resistance transporter
MNPKIAVPVVVVSVSFMNVMDVTIVNVALPSIGRTFDQAASPPTAVSVAYLLSLAVVIPAAGWIGSRVGMKRSLLGAIGLFTAASALCGVAPSLAVLVLARAMQGVGGGAMLPIGMAMLLRTFSAAERVRVSSMMVIPTAFGPAVGPVIGGLLVTDLSWRWVFYVNLPIGLAALVFGWWSLVEMRDDAVGAFDTWGFVLAGTGFASLLLGVTSGAAKGWNSPFIVASLLVGAVLIAITICVETRVADPLLALRLYRNRLFRSGSVAFIAGVASLFGLLFMVPLFLQIGLGRTALQTGVDICPEAFGVMVGSQLTSRILYPRLGPRRLVIAGLVGVSSTSLAMTLVGGGSDVWLIRSLMFCLGMSMGPVYVAAQAAAFATVKSTDMAHAASLFNSQRQFGTAVGVALLSTVLSLAGGATARSDLRPADLSGYHRAFAVAALFGLGGAVVATAISDADAADTIVRRLRKRPQRDGALCRDL